jgi:hypothetical protein
MNRTLKLQVKDNEYSIDYPNTGSQIDIELLKAKIADGNYDALRFSSNPLFQKQADVIDVISTFTILVPTLKQQLNVKSFFELQEDQMNVLIECYTSQFIPWYIEIKKSLQPAVKQPKDQLTE